MWGLRPYRKQEHVQERLRNCHWTDCDCTTQTWHQQYVKDNEAMNKDMGYVPTVKWCHDSSGKHSEDGLSGSNQVICVHFALF